MVIDTDNEKITDANAWLIAKAIMMDHDWPPITFWSNEIKDEEFLAALIYSAKEPRSRSADACA